MLRPIRSAITSGDSSGIGPEVTAKALYKIGPQKNLNFYLWRNSQFPKKYLALIEKKFKLVKCSSWQEALSKTPASRKELVDICSNTNPALWVEEAAQACFFKHLDSITTAPLSKPTIAQSGLGALGQTEILKNASQSKNAYMVFIGKKFSVFLCSGHVPITELSSYLSFEKLKTALESANKFYDLFIKKGGVGVLGINPHAGDFGIIGHQEKDFFDKLITKPFVGPLVPDAAFVRENRKKYKLFVAMYHDQGLIPFKTIHGHQGVHITWGLPFIRTSVDHGTAFDIAGRGIADETSMLMALKLAIKLLKGTNKEK
ncbi:MAG: 4-hydroxythreonine-4-phosphate dehydrogenase PdxA [Oligoflexia bacterium]|nr:4-hydroxythreonine-4-phosphate dehydrogenase PdxA [Oligoflexia bacterium]